MAEELVARNLSKLGPPKECGVLTKCMGTGRVKKENKKGLSLLLTIIARRLVGFQPLPEPESADLLDLRLKIQRFARAVSAFGNGLEPGRCLWLKQACAVSSAQQGFSPAECDEDAFLV